MTIHWGFSGLSHDAALAVFQDNQLVFAAHSERYSRIKNDKFLNTEIIGEALAWGQPDKVFFYETPWLKKTRQISAGQFHLLFQTSPRQHLKSFGITAPIVYQRHHESHACAGYYTAPFDRAAVLCLDSIGEWETLSLWLAEHDTLTRITSQGYPHSVGLWYSAMTQRIGLKPQEHEYILMGMAALGDPNRFYNNIKDYFIQTMPEPCNADLIFKRNLHRGCMEWMPDLVEADYPDVAAATQKLFEEIVTDIFEFIRCSTNETNLVLMGGSALNCVANTIATQMFENVWIMPNPGDAGSAIGAVLADHRRAIAWPGPFLGHDIPGEYPVDQILKTLIKHRVTGVAAGRAEFGPRALGNRSLLADPRGKDIKDLVNQYKQRELFRPFAPAILAEHVHKYFDVPKGFESPYMQYTVKCKRPDLFPAIVHYDNTSRVQTVTQQDNPGFRRLLERWYETTGCPMLLNTSLNIKGEPLLNSLEDAKRWEAQYGIPICVPINK